MNLRACLLTVSLCVLPSLAPAMRAQSSAADRLLQAMRQASNLDADDKVPYHIKVSYDLYDLYDKKGRKKSTGTIERWSWPGAGHSRLIVNGATYKIPAPEGAELKASREAYLVRLLTHYVLNPAPPVSQKAPAYGILYRALGGNNYTCLAPLKAPTGNEPTYAPEDQQFADDPDIVANRAWCSLAESSPAERVAFDYNDFVAFRNKMAAFNGVSYAQEVTLQYAGVVAIVGHVDLLEVYAPTAEEMAPVKRAAALPAAVPGGVAGKAVKKTPPTYPQSARSNRIQGTVLVAAILSKQGTVSSLDVISSPDKSLSEAATDAIKHWVYQPYLLNGLPTEVDTTINVNFNMSPGPRR